MREEEPEPILSSEALASMDPDALDMAVDFMHSQCDIAQYAELLRYGRSKWPEEWQHRTLSAYFGAMVKSLDRAWPGDFEELDEDDVPQLTWRGVARLLNAARGEERE